MSDAKDDAAFKAFWDSTGDLGHLGTFTRAVAAWDACKAHYVGSQEPVAWTNSYQLSYLQEPKYGLTPMAMWATAFDETTIPLYTTPPAQPVQPAGAQGEPVDLRELFERLLLGTYAGKDSYYNDEQIKHGCFERAQELVDVAKRMNIALYTEAPAVAVNEQMLAALKELMYARTDKAEGMADAAIAAAEAAKGGV